MAEVARDDDVEVIGHEAVRAEAQFKSLNGSPEERDPSVAISVVSRDRDAIDTARVCVEEPELCEVRATYSRHSANRKSGSVSQKDLLRDLSQGQSLGQGQNAQVRGTVPGTWLEAGRRAEPAFVRARGDDLGDLVEREVELLVAREVVRPEADSCVRAEVAKDLPLRQLLVHGLEVGDANGDCPAPPLAIAPRTH